MHSATGVSLLELIIVLLTTMLTVTFGLPGLQKFTANQRILAAANGLVTDLNHARSEAVMRSSTVVICPSRDRQQCAKSPDWGLSLITFHDRNHDKQRQTDEKLLFQRSQADQLNMHSRRRHNVRFFPNGSAPGSTITIYVCAKTVKVAARKVVVANTGRIRSEKLSREKSRSRCQ